jgi:hypothetical protein
MILIVELWLSREIPPFEDFLRQTQLRNTRRANLKDNVLHPKKTTRPYVMDFFPRNKKWRMRESKRQHDGQIKPFGGTVDCQTISVANSTH